MYKIQLVWQFIIINLRLSNKVMIIKLNYKSQTHLYNKTISLQRVRQYTLKAFRDLPKQFTFIYQSPDGQMTYIESDHDLIGLKYCCSAKNDYIVKLIIMKSDKLDEEQMDSIMSEIVSINMQQINSKIIKDLEEEAIKDGVKNYLSGAYEKASQTIANAENEIIQTEVGHYLETLYNVTSLKLSQTPKIRRVTLQKPRSAKVVRFSPIKKQKTLDEIIDQKIMKLVPLLVDKIYSQIEAKLQNKCKKCIKSEIALQKAIDQEINKRMNSSGEFQILDSDQNPEY